jgi:hypothetical protein
MLNMGIRFDLREIAFTLPGAASGVNRKRRHDRIAAALKSRELSEKPQHIWSSCAGLTRVSIIFEK